MIGRSRPDRDDRSRHTKYWQARGSRAEYWTATALVAGLTFISPGMSASAAAGPMLIFTIRRLHDFGRTGWWSALPLGFVLCGIGLVAFPLGLLIQGMLLVASVGFTAFVGLMPGDAGQNRFGEPQALFRRKVRT